MYKRTIKLIALALIIGISSTNAQIRFGAKAGINISSLNISALENWSTTMDSKTGYQVGPMMELMAPPFGLGADVALLYSQRGMGIGTQTITSDYLEIPINLKWKVGLPIAKVFVAAGPYLAFAFDSDNVITTVATLSQKTTSAGLNVGAGVEVLKFLQVGANYTMEMTSSFSGEGNIGDQLFKLTDGNIRGWTISAALLF